MECPLDLRSLNILYARESCIAFYFKLELIGHLHGLSVVL